MVYLSLYQSIINWISQPSFPSILAVVDAWAGISQICVDTCNAISYPPLVEISRRGPIVLLLPTEALLIGNERKEGSKLSLNWSVELLFGFTNTSKSEKGPVIQIVLYAGACMCEVNPFFYIKKFIIFFLKSKNAKYFLIRSADALANFFGLFGFSSILLLESC